MIFAHQYQKAAWGNLASGFLLSLACAGIIQ